MFKTIIDFPNYEIDEFGNIFNKNTQRLIVPEITNAGYARVKLTGVYGRDKVYIHRLVYATYGLECSVYDLCGQVKHCNDDHLDNYIGNLRYKMSLKSGKNE